MLFKKTRMTNNVTVNKTFRYGLMSLKITNVMKLRRQLFFERKANKEPKLSINLVVLLFGSIYIYIYMCISA